MKKVISLVLSAVIILSASACAADTSVTAEAAANVNTTATTAEETESEQDNSMRDITTMELVREMGYGINLGNTFEACGDWINGKT
ncbi:MAG: acid shock protein, partial [Oscillospiraceae bacterium]